MRLLAALLGVIALPLTTQAVDISGKWTLDINPDFGGTQTVLNCTFTQSSENVTLLCADTEGNPPSRFTGTVKEQTLTFVVKTGPKDEYTATFTGTVSERDTTIAGTWVLADQRGKRQGKFTGRKR